MSKVKLLLDEVNLGIKEVPDPYYGGVDGFEDVYQMIDMACEAIAKKLN
jgi:protein-tyrosine phosphatase